MYLFSRKLKNTNPKPVFNLLQYIIGALSSNDEYHITEYAILKAGFVDYSRTGSHDSG